MPPPSCSPFNNAAPIVYPALFPQAHCSICHVDTPTLWQEASRVSRTLCMQLSRS
jgi:hypothetical protein